MYFTKMLVVLAATATMVCATPVVDKRDVCGLVPAMQNGG